MSIVNKHINSILKDKFSSFEADIPLSDWYGIEKKLNIRKRRIIIFWFSVLIVFLLVVGGISFNYYYLKNENSSKIVIIDKPNSEVKIKKPIDKILDISKLEYADKNKFILISKSNKQKFEEKIVQDISEKNFIPSYLPIELKTRNITNIFNLKFEELSYVKNLNLKKFLNDKNNRKNKISFEIGINFSPAMGMETIKENKSMNKFINRTYFNSINGSSAFGNGMNNGLNAQINFKEKFYFRSGMYISSYNVHHNYNYTISEFANVDPKYGILSYLPTSPEIVKHNGISKLKFLAIPVSLGNRAYINNNFGIESKIGFNFSKFLNSDGKSVNPTYLNLEDIDKSNIRNWSKGYSVSIGIFYKSKRNFIFTIEPNYSSLIGSAYSKTYPVKNRLYNYGLNFNINYIINRGEK